MPRYRGGRPSVCPPSTAANGPSTVIPTPPAAEVSWGLALLATSPHTRDPMTKKAKTDLDTLEPVHLAPETVPEPIVELAKVNKSEEIRLEARRILDAGGNPRPRDII